MSSPAWRFWSIPSKSLSNCPNKHSCFWWFWGWLTSVNNWLFGSEACSCFSFPFDMLATWSHVTCLDNFHIFWFCRLHTQGGRKPYFLLYRKFLPVSPSLLCRHFWHNKRGSNSIALTLFYGLFWRLAFGMMFGLLLDEVQGGLNLREWKRFLCESVWKFFKH